VAGRGWELPKVTRPREPETLAMATSWSIIRASVWRGLRAIVSAWRAAEPVHVVCADDTLSPNRRGRSPSNQRRVSYRRRISQDEHCFHLNLASSPPILGIVHRLMSSLVWKALIFAVPSRSGSLGRRVDVLPLDILPTFLQSQNLLHLVVLMGLGKPY
jgi:hypothetical protein